MCEETTRMVKGESGKLLEKYYNNQMDTFDKENFLTIDRRMFNRSMSREPIHGQVTHLQIKLKTDVWFALSQLLQTQLTTQTLITLHIKELNFVRENVKVTLDKFM